MEWKISLHGFRWLLLCRAYQSFATPSAAPVNTLLALERLRRVFAPGYAMGWDFLELN